MGSRVFGSCGGREVGLAMGSQGAWPCLCRPGGEGEPQGPLLVRLCLCSCGPRPCTPTAAALSTCCLPQPLYPADPGGRSPLPPNGGRPQGPQGESPPRSVPGVLSVPECPVRGGQGLCVGDVHVLVHTRVRCTLCVRVCLRGSFTVPATCRPEGHVCTPSHLRGSHGDASGQVGHRRWAVGADVPGQRVRGQPRPQAGSALGRVATDLSEGSVTPPATGPWGSGCSSLSYAFRVVGPWVCPFC